MSLNCPTPNPNPQSKPSVDLSKVSNIRKLIRENQAMRRKLRQQFASAARQQAQDEALTEKEVFEEWALSIEKAVSLDPTEGLKAEDQLAALFNYKANNPLDAGLEFNTAGEIRSNLASAKQAAMNMIDLATKYVTSRKVREYRVEFDRLLKQYNVPKDRWDEIRLQIHEIGQQWDNAPLTGRTPGQEWLMKYREDKLISELTSYGMVQSDINDMVEASRSLSGIFDDVRTIANMTGVQVGEVNNIGYFRRALQERYNVFFEAKYGSKKTENTRYFGIGSTAVKKSRESWHFIPEDFQALTTLPAFKGKTEQELMQMWTSEPLKFRQFLHDKVSYQELETLVETGLMSKIPMSAVELNDYLNEVFPLPFKAVAEKFKTDPVEALADYGQELKRAAGESAMFKYVGSFGARNGWAVPADVVRQNADKYKGFIALNQASFERFGLGDLYDVMSPTVREDLGKMYVHPRVERQLMSLARVSTRPEELGEIAQVFLWMNKHLNVAAMLGSGHQYVTRLLGGSIINAVSAGVDIPKILPRIWEFVQVHKQGLEAAKGRTYTVGGKQYTAAEMAKEFFRRQGQDVIPLHGTSDVPNLANLNPVLLPRALRDIYEYSKMFGDPLIGAKMTTAYTAKQFDKMIQSSFQPLAAVANYMELAIKYATWMSLFKQDGIKLPGRLGIFETFDDFDKASRYLDEYFVNYHTIGEAPAALRNFIPFAGYVLQNPPMQWRDMLRRPLAYSAYLKALQRAGRGSCAADLYAAGFTEQELDSFPVVVGCDANTQRASVMFPANYDPKADTFIFVQKGAKFGLRLFGQDTGNPFTDLKTATGEGNLLQDVISELGQMGNQTFKTSVEMMTGRSLFNDAPIWEDDDFRGIKVNPTLRYLLTRYPLISAIEQDRGIGKLFSPLFPEKRVEDELGNEVSPGRPGLLADVPLEPMTRSEKKRWLAENSGSYFQRLAMEAGMSVKTIDIDEGSQFTLSSLYASHRELNGKWEKAVEEMAKQRLAGKDVSSKRQELMDLASAIDQLELDALRLKAYLQSRGIPEKSVLNQVKELKLEQGIRSLPTPVGFEDIVRDVARKRMETFMEKQNGNK